MSRSVVRQQVNTSRNENKHDERSERVKDLIKIEKVNRQDSFESHFEVSTRGDGSFEYSDYDDQSFNQSQSFMDQTHGPALLAFVEDYILGQRLEILDTCETEEDAASSSSSSFGSETCNSREESRIYKYFKTTNRGISSKNIENTKVEVPITTDTVHETVVTKKSRWEYLLQGLSAVKRKEYIDNQTHSLTLTNKKDKIIMSRPKFLAAIKAKTSSKETETFRNEETDVVNLTDMSHRVRNSLSEETSTCDVATKSIDNLQCTKMEDEKQVLTNNISMEQACIDANDCISESKSGHPHTFEITDAEHMEKLLTVYSQQGTLINVAQNSKEATLKPINTNVVNVSNDSEVNLSVHSDGVEIPNIPQFEIQSSPPIKSRTDKYFLRGRATRHERLVATCTGLCDTNQSDVANVKRSVENQIDSTALRKPILCSKCRGTLTDNSVCALLPHESFITLPETGIPLSDIEVEPNVCFSIDPSNSRAPTLGLINEECDMGCEMNDNVAEKNDSTTVDHSTRSLDEKVIKETLNPTNETGFCCEAPVSDPIYDRAASVIHLHSTQNEEPKESPVANIEATIAGGSPCRRSTTPTVQIEFKDWTGNDVEIIKESPRKNRLHWIQGVVSNNKTPPIESESSTTCVKNTDERKKDEDDIIKEEKQFHSSASVCNFEMTSCVHEKKLTKSRYFGRERVKQDLEEKTVRISPVNIPNSVTEDVDDAISQGNTECCLESSAASLTSRVLQEEDSSGGQEDSVTKLHTTTQSNPLIHDTEEAFILERAMQQVHTDEKFTIGHSRTRSRISSPVTLYRFLDFNPCRNELVQGNSYDFVYDPIGLAVCQVPNLDLPITIASGKNMSDLEVKKQNVVSMEAKSIHHKPGSSLKKVLRRLSKPNKVAFRENLVDVYSKDSEVHFANTTIMELPDQTEVLDDNAATDVGFGNSRNISETKNTPRQSELKIATKDKLKALMTEKSKGKRDNMQCKELVGHGSNKSLGGSNMSLGSAAKVLAALKAEFMKRRKSNHKEQLSKSEAHKEQLPQRNTHEKKKQIEVLPKLSNANAALILQEFKKAHATGNLDRGNELEISAQEGSDGTIATSGTKQSQISSVSRLTVEEKKLAHRLLNDIQLLAMIEKKRQSMGQLKSSLKSADIDKSVKLLKSIEASRKSRASKDSDSKISTTIKQLASKSTEKPNDFHTLTKNASVVGKKLSTLTDITSTEKFNK